jgi:protein-disulfide isomerase
MAEKPYEGARMNKNVETIATVIMVVSAVGMVGLATRAELRVQRAVASQLRVANPVEYKDWRTFEASGVRVGPSDARATVVEFVDYECPFCRVFHGELSSVMADFEKKQPGQVATVFVHFPIPSHRFAKSAAQAVECGGEQGRFGATQSIVFAKQDSFGLKPWSEYASEAGLKDAKRFAACMKDSSTARRVLAGMALAERLKLRGTPTVLLNGWAYSGVPSREQLHAAIERVLSGRAVFDTSQGARRADGTK